MDKNQNTSPQTTEISLPEIIDIIKKYWSYLLSKWLIIVIFGFTGAALGILASFIIKPKYTAHISFALVEKSSGGGLADLASSFGFSGLGGGSGSAFSGDNLLEIIKSRYAIEKTLLTPVQYNGTRKTLVEVYIDFSELREKWLKNTRKPELQKLSYPVGQKRETFSRVQDSVLFTIYDGLIKSQALSVVRKDKKLSIVNVDFSSKDELFSKIFVETLMDETYRFYRETKTSQSLANIKMMQHTADSIKALYEGALNRGAGFSAVNINPALQFAAVPRVKQQNNAELYGKVYAEVLKNLETLKLDMARDIPIVQMIDTPRYPLIKTKLGVVKGFVFGGFIGSVLILFYLVICLFFKPSLNDKNYISD